MTNHEYENERATRALELGYGKAEEIIKDQDKLERLLDRLEVKLKEIPIAGEKLSYIPVLVQLVRSYTKKEFTDIPIGSLIAIVSALVYFLSPIDLIPDSIPVLGYSDDAAVVGVCWKLVESDVKEYQEWRKNR